MENPEKLGKPSSYLVLAQGVEVYSRDGKSLGKVEHVLIVPELDLFDGIVIDRSILPGGHRFVDAPEIGEIYEYGVILKIDFTEAEKLPVPSPNPGALEVGADEMVPDGKHERLRRAWDMISGKG
jgi:uncharacterized protein YrrD